MSVTPATAAALTSTMPVIVATVTVYDAHTAFISNLTCVGIALSIFFSNFQIHSIISTNLFLYYCTRLIIIFHFIILLPLSFNY